MHGLADGTQSKALHIDLPERYPCTLRSIVSGPYRVIAFHMTEIEHVECVDIHT